MRRRIVSCFIFLLRLTEKAPLFKPTRAVFPTRGHTHLVPMRGSRNFCWGGGPGPTFLGLNLFYSFTVVYQWFISKKTIIFQGFKGVQHLSGGVQNFSGGGGGQLFSKEGGIMLICMETHRTCVFSRGFRTHYPPLDLHLST